MGGDVFTTSHLIRAVFAFMAATSIFAPDPNPQQADISLNTPIAMLRRNTQIQSFTHGTYEVV